VAMSMEAFIFLLDEALICINPRWPP